jgi:Cu-processing system permease protein
MIPMLQLVLRDLWRSRWPAAYGLFLLATSEALFAFGENRAQAVASLLTVTVLVVPTMTLALGVSQCFDWRYCAELLLAQPVRRGAIFAGQYVGLTLVLSLSFVFGVGLPFLWMGLGSRAAAQALAVLLAAGILLTLVFGALALLLGTASEQRLPALGRAFSLALFLCVVYDGILLAAATGLADYRLEKPLLALALLNPVDAARLLVLLKLDVAALTGYTGAVMQQFFGAGAQSVALLPLALWVAVPAALAYRAYQRRDF